jgi:cell wall assembly regulator SMI1
MTVAWRNYVWNQPHPALPDEIASLEEWWGVSLPDDYKQVVMLHQGMSPRPNAFDVGKGENVIAALLIISPDEQQHAYSIKGTYAQVKPHVPDGIYPLAVTGTGDYVCFDYREAAHFPRIVLYFAEESGEEAIYPVADSFSDLLARLHD